MPYLERYVIQENDVFQKVEITEEQAEEYRKFDDGEIEVKDDGPDEEQLDRTRAEKE